MLFIRPGVCTTPPVNRLSFMLLTHSYRPRRTARLFAACLFVTFCAAALRAQTDSAAGAGRVRLTGSFRAVTPLGKVAQAATATTVRDTLTAAEASAPLRIQLPLRLRNSAELERRVAAGEIISREEMAVRFLPEEKDYQAVAGWLASQGLTVEPAGASREAVIATGTPAQLEKAFEVHFARVQFRGEEHTSSTVAPSLPTEIEARVRGVHGLQPHLHPHKSGPVKQAKMNAGQPPFVVGDILAAYDVNASGLTGAGQTIAVVIDTLPVTTDLTGFWTDNGVSQSLSNYSTVNVEDRPIGSPSGEETLDVEWSSGIASGAKIVVYACGDLNYVNDCYTRVLDDLQSGAQPNLHQVTMSYGAGEISDETQDDIDSVHQTYTAIAAYGVSLFASAGDEGAYGNDEGRVEAEYPATDPLVTAVGGTSLILNSSDVITHETGWSPSSDQGAHDSSGGGISIYFARPSWQVGTGVNLNAMRQIPDVSLVGDPDTGCFVFFHGKSEQDGGTSLSTPIWAGLCALINQNRANNGLSPMSGFNAAIYPQLGTSAFHDITVGNNVIYNCTVGYDLVTGLGTPDFNVLDQKLERAPFFTGEVALSNGVYYLSFPNGNYFGYYSYLTNPRYLYHFDLGYEYWFDANDGKSGIYFYDFASNSFFYTNPTFPFPYLYDFALKAVLYYYPSSTSGHYTTGPRYFFNFATGKNHHAVAC